MSARQMYGTPLRLQEDEKRSRMLIEDTTTSFSASFSFAFANGSLPTTVQRMVLLLFLNPFERTPNGQFFGEIDLVPRQRLRSFLAAFVASFLPALVSEAGVRCRSIAALAALTTKVAEPTFTYFELVVIA